jgi:signal transduction histidine kinase
MTLATPLFDKAGRRLGVLAIHLNLDRMDKIILTRAGLGETGETYLIDRSSRFVSGERFGRETFAQDVHSQGVDAALQSVDGFGLYQNYAGVPVIGVYRWIEDRELALLAEMHQQEAFAPARQLATVILLIGLVSTLVLAIGVYWLARRIARPILRIADTASRVTAGDLTQTVPVLTQDEVGVLAHAFNQMIEQLRDLLNTLENRVAARTRDLQIAADVAKQITTVLDIDELLQQVVALTVESFGLYGCLIYLLDEKEQILVQQIGADAQGNKLLIEKVRRIPLEAEPSVIALAARRREAVVVNDTAQSPAYLVSPSLVKTRSELAIPMTQGERLLGVFDLQSDSVNAFDEADLRVLTTLAEQTAIAVGNAQLFAEVQAARRAAEAASRAKSTFLSVVSHELRTPLTSVLGFAKIIKKRLENVVFPHVIADSDSDEHTVQRAVRQVQSNIDIIVAEGERLKALINNVLDLAKIESGRIEWRMEPVSVSEVLERAVAIMGPSIDKPLELEAQVEPDLPLVIGDRDRLTQVIVNLISNAVKFTNEGSITCRAQRTEAEIKVSVTDTGIGIAAGDQKRVFEQFVQAGDTLTNRPRGTGLGLSICRNIVEHHGGRIWVESELGVGSSFIFTLPVASRVGE